MKLKEKLAEEYSRDIHTGDRDSKIMAAYLAGFDKAVYMAIFLDRMEPPSDWKTGHKLENMGEEEV